MFLAIVGGVSLAGYQHKIAIGAGGLALLISAILKKGSMWWIFGAIVMILGIFFLWIDPQ